MYDLSKRQSTFVTANVSGFGQPEYFVQMRLIQAIEACWNDKKSIIKQAQASRTLGQEEGWGSLLCLLVFVFIFLSCRSFPILFCKSNLSSHFRYLYLLARCPSLPVWLPDCFHLYPSLPLSRLAAVWLVLCLLCSTEQTIPLSTKRVSYGRFCKWVRLATKWSSGKSWFSNLEDNRASTNSRSLTCVWFLLLNVKDT